MVPRFDSVQFRSSSVQNVHQRRSASFNLWRCLGSLVSILHCSLLFLVSACHFSVFLLSAVPWSAAFTAAFRLFLLSVLTWRIYFQSTAALSYDLSCLSFSPFLTVLPLPCMTRFVAGQQFALSSTKMTRPSLYS